MHTMDGCTGHYDEQAMFHHIISINTAVCMLIWEHDHNDTSNSYYSHYVLHNWLGLAVHGTIDILDLCAKTKQRGEII